MDTSCRSARGGLIGKKYPHGDELTPKDANYWRWDKLAPSGGGIVEVGKYPANGYGLYDMAGNVWEWCNDRYDDAYYQYCVDHNIYYEPKGPTNDNDRVTRGGSWASYVFYLRCAGRINSHLPDDRYLALGFRLVLEIP